MIFILVVVKVVWELVLLWGAGRKCWNDSDRPIFVDKTHFL